MCDTQNLFGNILKYAAVCNIFLKRENNSVAIVLNIGDNQAFVLTFVEFGIMEHCRHAPAIWCGIVLCQFRVEYISMGITLTLELRFESKLTVHTTFLHYSILRSKMYL
jgi:hypothetical protein